ncbi:MAG TPA: phytanoyl-CoA dioxygenase family protein [Allosphingosinicella sp.]|jgi:ectoine hydroxylase-related dioxygenase (phytanoyl-CoA dioxygenase family)|nr:phytanoyl-CoA dioxygenase family protein [Allosphingosinicella sp.]
MQKIFADAASQSAFERDGFAVVRLLSAATATALRGRLEELEAAAPVALGAGEALRKSHYHPEAEHRTAMDALAREAIAAPLASAISGYRLDACMFLTKVPGAREMNIHRDWTTMADLQQVALNVWCPLVKVHEGNGTLAVLPGSQILPNVETPQVPRFYAPYGDALKKRCVKFDLQPGQAVIYDNRLLHWSTTNRSDAPRPVLRASAVPAEARIVFYRLDSESGGKRFEILDVAGAGLLAQTPAELAATGQGGASLGYVANENRPLSLRECERLLDRRERAASRGQGFVGGVLKRMTAILGA